MKKFLLALCVIACAFLTYINWDAITTKVTGWFDEIKTNQEEVVEDETAGLPYEDEELVEENNGVTMSVKFNI